MPMLAPINDTWIKNKLIARLSRSCGDLQKFEGGGVPGASRTPQLNWEVAPGTDRTTMLLTLIASPQSQK